MAAWTPPEAVEGEDGWWKFTSTAELTSTNVAGVVPGGASPECAVAHFYASRIRGDDRWREVLPPEAEWDASLPRKLAKMESWAFEGLRFLQRKPKSRGRFWVKVGLDVRIGARLESVVNEVTVQSRGDGWVVTRPPT